MKILKRTQFGNPILRAKSRLVPVGTIKTSAFRNLVRQMFHTMHRVRGVGLAAPQIGKPWRMAVIGVGPARAADGSRTYFRRVVINPKITWHSKSKQMDWEGCLSFTDARGKVPRWSAIKVEYTDEKGNRIKESHRGFIARVFQHEIDHLDGIVYVDRMKDMKTLSTHGEFMKQIARRA